MDNHSLAKRHYHTASVIFEEAKELFRKGVFHLVVRRSQECVELALKGLLEYFGIDYPKKHDVGDVLQKVLTQRNIGNKDTIDRLVKISKELAENREVSFYGSENGKAPDELFSQGNAEKAITEATYVLEFTKGILRE